MLLLYSLQFLELIVNLLCFTYVLKEHWRAQGWKEKKSDTSLKEVEVLDMLEKGMSIAEVANLQAVKETAI